MNMLNRGVGVKDKNGIGSTAVCLVIVGDQMEVTIVRVKAHQLGAENVAHTTDFTIVLIYLAT